MFYSNFDFCKKQIVLFCFLIFIFLKLLKLPNICLNHIPSHFVVGNVFVSQEEQRKKRKNTRAGESVLELANLTPEAMKYLHKSKATLKFPECCFVSSIAANLSVRI